MLALHMRNQMKLTKILRNQGGQPQKNFYAVFSPMGTKWCITTQHSCSVFRFGVKLRGRKAWSGNRLLNNLSTYCLLESFQIMTYSGWCLQTPQPPLQQRLKEDLIVFRVMLLKGYTGPGCLPQLDLDIHTKTAVPLYGLCEGKEPTQLSPFLQ